MPSHRDMEDRAFELSEACFADIVSRVAAGNLPAGELPATDEQISTWSRRAYTETKRSYLSEGLETREAEEAAFAVALAVVTHCSHHSRGGATHNR